jgi:benzil reductase ((S)-benzoin forming)
MNYFYISGSSRGIGKALAEELLKDSNNYVIGFSRTNTIKHEHFEFIPIDLSDTAKAMQFSFIDIIDADSITLINNSGMIGQVDHMGKIDNQSITETFNVNVVSPAILINNFIKAYQKVSCKKLIINISSGAARNPIESWGAYCASKAALDMYTSVAQLEQNVLDPSSPVKFFSIAPGIVDTQMQDQIRNVSHDSFGEVDKFITYKKENKLLQSSVVAVKIKNIIENSDKITKTIMDLRELDF